MRGGDDLKLGETKTVVKNYYYYKKKLDDFLRNYGKTRSRKGTGEEKDEMEERRER